MDRKELLKQIELHDKHIGLAIKLDWTMSNRHAFNSTPYFVLAND